MKIIVGLGNPGPKYETTRHNAGFLLIDRLVEEWKAGSPQMREHGEVFTASVAGEKILLVKPQTFMNVSGKCVGPLFHFHKCEPEDLIVAHDEVDLPPITLRLKTGGGTGGHNGLKSIDAALGAGKNGYHRVRIGVGHPSKLGLPQDAAAWVLAPFTDDELVGLDRLFDTTVKAIEQIVRGDMRGAMNEYNRVEKPEAKTAEKK